MLICIFSVLMDVLWSVHTSFPVWIFECYAWVCVCMCVYVCAHDCIWYPRRFLGSLFMPHKLCHSLCLEKFSAIIFEIAPLCFISLSSPTDSNYTNITSFATFPQLLNVLILGGCGSTLFLFAFWAG